MKAMMTPEPDCYRAIKTWNSFASKFPSRRPVYSAGEEGLYADPSIQAFLTLYNPKPDATLDCRMVTCTQSTTAKGGGGGGAQSTFIRAVEEKLRNRLARARNSGGSMNVIKGYGLVCVTAPKALTDKEAPFT